MARMPAWEAPTELVSRPMWEVWPADCVAEVTCVVWLWAVLFSGGYFGARRRSDRQPEGVCDNSIFDEIARLLEATVCVHGSRWVGSAWCAHEAAALVSVLHLAAACGGWPCFVVATPVCKRKTLFVR
jgi:hypothetical protein